MAMVGAGFVGVVLERRKGREHGLNRSVDVLPQALVGVPALEEPMVRARGAVPRDVAFETEVDLEVTDVGVHAGDLGRPRLLAHLLWQQALDGFTRSDRRDDDRRSELLSRARAHADRGSLLDEDRAHGRARAGAAARGFDDRHQALGDRRCAPNGVARAVEVVPDDGGVNAEARLIGHAAKGAPLRSQDCRELRIGDVVGDDVAGRAPAPSLDLVLVPPAMRGTERLGHRPFGGHQVHRLSPRLQGFEVGIDRGSLVGKAIFQLHLERFDRASHRQLESVGEMERVVHGAHRGELDGATTQPFEHLAGWLIATERAAVVKAHVPGEAFPGKSVRQSADLLGLLEEQDAVTHAGQRGRGGHAAHTGANDDDVEFGFVPHAASVVLVTCAPA